ncbi:MAG TPA: fructose-bisphosphate aldolase [Deltaproteobacteria bacterium]|nr:MAG: fructose-bisphosphate aldolase [Deltaproteobacteria bacterium GWC2_65_14]HBO68955.1 fructose-bisphosphate aldolase [Deltaproteobacteria bacterium]
MDWKPLRKFVPGNAARRIPAGNPACPLNGHDVFRALAPRKVIVMACNIRIPSVIPGIMRAAEELGAVVAFELAKSEGDLAGGYTGMTPEIFASTIFDCAKRTGFSLPFLIHGDHITVKNTSEKEVEGSRALIAAEIEAGYTCFAIDASFNPIPDNARIVADLSRPITERGLGLEVEVGEIKAAGSEGALSTVEEAVELMERLADGKVPADLLAINNGSKHGNYLDGEQISLDLDRTGQIYEAVYGRFGVSIAQHGITGTPLHLVGRFADYGIRKGNVGTQWQNVAHAGLPPALMGKMRDWAKAAGKDIKFATKQFKPEIDSIPAEFARKIEEGARREALELLRAFRAEGTAKAVADHLSVRS